MNALALFRDRAAARKQHRFTPAGRTLRQRRGLSFRSRVDLDGAETAVGGSLDLLVKAERRNVEAGGTNRIQYRAAISDLNGSSVD